MALRHGREACGSPCHHFHEETSCTPITSSTAVRSCAAPAAGAGLLVATRTPVASLFGSADATAASSCASLTPAKTIGPYFVEEKLNRSDITTDPSTGAVTTGAPLALDLTLVNEDDGCSPFRSPGRHLARGPEWQVLRRVRGGHVGQEVPARLPGDRIGRQGGVQDGLSRAGTPGAPCTSTSACARSMAAGLRRTTSSRRCSSTTRSRTRSTAQSPYSTRGTRTTRNAGDNIYGSDGATLLLRVSSDGNGDYSGAFTFGLSAGTSGSTASASAGAGSSVGAALASASCTRSALGVRSVAAKLRTTEQVALDVRLRRGSRTIAQRTVTALGAGTRTVRLPLSKGVRSGRATLRDRRTRHQRQPQGTEQDRASAGHERR